MRFPWQHVSSELFILILSLFMFFCFSINLLGQRKKKLLLVALSLMVIAYLDWESLLYLLLVSHVAYYMIRYKHNSKHLYQTGFLFIALLMSYKFLQVIFMHFDAPHVLLLLGLSYFTFRITATLFDSARNALKEINYLDYLHFCLFFPIFIGGPVQRYNLFLPSEESFCGDMLYGLMRILRGAIKKILLADIIMAFFIDWIKSIALHSHIFQINTYSWPTAKVALFSTHEAVLLFGFLCIIRAYFDLSALTDIAIGLSQCFGYKVSENFNKPLLSLNIIDFWRRWHMTIANWARDYVFSPFLLKTRNIFVAVFATMICVGLWHQPSWRWLFWGVGHGVGLIVCGAWQRTRMSKRLQSIKTELLAREYTLVLPNIIKIARERNFSMLYRFQFIDVLSFPAYSIVRFSTTKLIRPLLKSVFNIPAWILNFSYMSFIFIAVSCPTTTEALRMYSILFGFGR